MPVRIQRPVCRRAARVAAWARSGSESCPESDCARSSTSTSATPATRSRRSSPSGRKKRPVAEAASRAPRLLAGHCRRLVMDLKASISPRRPGFLPGRAACKASAKLLIKKRQGHVRGLHRRTAQRARQGHGAVQAATSTRAIITISPAIRRRSRARSSARERRRMSPCCCGSVIAKVSRLRRRAA